jgi:starch synthase
LAIEVLFVASEIYPLVKTGGLADVVGALPRALAEEGVEVRTLVPGYEPVLDALECREVVHDLADVHGGPARLLAGSAAGLPLLAIDAPHLFRRPGGPYADASGRDWSDNAQRFGALAQIGAEIGQGLLDNYRPDIVHGHDWQAGLAPAYLHYAGGARPATVMTIHNLAFQGRYSADLLQALDLPLAAYSVDSLEYYGGIGFLKAGLQFADRITTVSPTYAAEIRTPGGGMGLEGLLQARAKVFSGILNGVDTSVWNPEADGHLAARYGRDNRDSRAENKRALRQRLGLEDKPDLMLVGMIGRLSWQKGVDLLLGTITNKLADNVQLAVLGAGDAELEDQLRAAIANALGRIGAVIGYDEALAHLIQGGADALIVPSRFEPCGLTQLCALRYGAVPIVARVGGLNDTVIDANEMALQAGVATGFQFSPVTRDGLEHAIDRAVAVWRKPETWRQMQVNGMSTDVSWRQPAAQYAELYRSLQPAN